MKLSIFVKWICVQILLAQCDAFLINSNATDVSTKVCIQKSINHLFSYDDTLSLILDNHICEEAIFEINTTRPYISLNFDTVEGIPLQYEGKFIICPLDASSLIHTVQRMHDRAETYRRRLGNSYILVITNTVAPSLIFKLFWLLDINNVIVLFYGQGISKLCICDRYFPANECGRTVKSIFYQNCEEQITFSFRNVIHHVNKCPITFMHHRNNIFTREKDHPSALYILHVIQELSNHHNATFQRIIYNHSSELPIYLSNKTNIVIGWATTKYRANHTVTEPLVIVDIVWLVPKAEQISNIIVFVNVFSCNVWVAVVVTLISVSLAWFLIISFNGGFTFEKLGLAFINVWSLTICGCIANSPRSFALRITLLSYLIYVIHIQCALTSNMATILTAPRYGFQIRNLEELAESGLPIYVIEFFKETQFNLNDSNHRLYTRLQKQLHPVPKYGMWNTIANINYYRNYAVIASADDVLQLEKNLSRNIHVHQIRDNSMTGVFTIRLCLPMDHYFAPILNSLLSKMEESGIGDKLKNDFNRAHFPKNVSVEENDEELTLSHLVFIFIFLGLGLSISCVVFCLEHVVHKFF